MGKVPWRRQQRWQLETQERWFLSWCLAANCEIQKLDGLMGKKEEMKNDEGWETPKTKHQQHQLMPKSKFNPRTFKWKHRDIFRGESEREREREKERECVCVCDRERERERERERAREIQKDIDRQRKREKKKRKIADVALSLHLHRTICVRCIPRNNNRHTNKRNKMQTKNQQPQTTIKIAIMHAFLYFRLCSLIERCTVATTTNNQQQQQQQPTHTWREAFLSVLFDRMMLGAMQTAMLRASILFWAPKGGEASEDVEKKNKDECWMEIWNSGRQEGWIKKKMNENNWRKKEKRERRRRRNETKEKEKRETNTGVFNKRNRAIETTNYQPFALTWDKHLNSLCKFLKA